MSLGKICYQCKREDRDLLLVHGGGAAGICSSHQHTLSERFTPKYRGALCMELSGGWMLCRCCRQPSKIHLCLAKPPKPCNYWRCSSEPHLIPPSASPRVVTPHRAPSRSLLRKRRVSSSQHQQSQTRYEQEPSRSPTITQLPPHLSLSPCPSTGSGWQCHSVPWHPGSCHGSTQHTPPVYQSSQPA